MAKQKRKTPSGVAKFFRKEVLGVDVYHVEGSPCPIKLNQNELPFRPVEVERGVTPHFIEPSLNRYPDEGASRLREALGKHLNWPANGISVANGSNVLVQGLMIACAIGSKVLTVAPTFPLYRLEARIMGNRLIEVQLNDDFSLPLETFLKTMKREKPKLVILPNPNAPTGNLFAEKAVLKIIENSPCLVVLDEAYYPFSNKTYFPELKKFKNLVILRTFSKSMGLAGARLGYLLGHPEVVEQIEKVLLPFRLSQLAQHLGVLALENQKKADEKTAQIVKERERVAKILKEFKGITPYPSAANFILLGISPAIGAKNLFKELMQGGVLVRDFAKTPRLEETLRVTIGQKQENDEFLARLKDILR